jgi:hypothetical protein
MRFGVIWESQDVCNENKYNYYFQPVHYGSAAKMPLFVVNTKNKANMYNYTLSILQDIRGINSDAGERNSREIGITSLQVTMFNCDRYSGANQDSQYLLNTMKLIEMEVNLQKKLIASPLEHPIDPNYDFNPRNQYLTLINQKQKCRRTR